MISLLIKIVKGLAGFFRGIVTIITYIPKAFQAVWSFFGMLVSLIGTLPAGLAALGAFVIVCAIIYLIIGR